MTIKVTILQRGFGRWNEITQTKVRLNYDCRRHVYRILAQLSYLGHQLHLLDIGHLCIDGFPRRFLLGASRACNSAIHGDAYKDSYPIPTSDGRFLREPTLSRYLSFKPLNPHMILELGSKGPCRYERAGISGRSDHHFERVLAYLGPYIGGAFTVS